MTTLYRPVLIETADDLDQLEEYYVKEAGPGGAWQIVLVPVEAEEETAKSYPSGEPYYTHALVGGGRESWRYIIRDDEGSTVADVTDEMRAWEASRKIRTRLVTPWEEA